MYSFSNITWVVLPVTCTGTNNPSISTFRCCWLMTFPWSFLLIPALRRRFGRNEQLILLWALAPLIFFSLSGSKLPAYILPMLPPLALLCGREVARRDSLLSYRIAAFAQAALWVAVGVAFGFFGDQINIDIQVNGMAILAITLVMAAALVAIGIWLPPPALRYFECA